MSTLEIIGTIVLAELVTIATSVIIAKVQCYLNDKYKED